MLCISTLAHVRNRANQAEILPARSVERYRPAGSIEIYTDPLRKAVRNTVTLAHSLKGERDQQNTPAEQQPGCHKHTTGGTHDYTSVVACVAEMSRSTIRAIG